MSTTDKAKSKNLLDTVELRRQAEEVHKENHVDAPLLEEVDKLRLINELQVHQIELEIQNEELKRTRAELEDGLERYTDLYDFAPAGYFTLLKDGTVKQVNLYGARLLGVERSYLVERRFGVFVDSGDRSIFNAFLDNVFDLRGNQVCELILNKDEIDRRPAREYFAGQVLNEPARVIVQIEAQAANDGLTCRAVVQDITERKQYEESLRWLSEISNSMASNLEFLPGLFLDQIRKIIHYTYAAIFQLEESSLVALAMRGTPQMEQSTPIRIYMRSPETLENLFNEPRPIRIANIWNDDPQARFLRSLLNEGAPSLLQGIQSWMWVPLAVRGRLIGGVGIADARKNYFTTHHADLALNIANHASIAMINAELYRHAQTLAIFEERQRLARNLHDAINQSLFSAGLIAEVLPRLWDRDQAEARQSLQDLVRLMRGAQAEMRALLAELRPSTLTDSNLGDLLQLLGNALSGRTNLPIKVKVLKDFILPAEVQVTFYRICQEALFNIGKHSKAKHVEVVLTQENEVIELRIRDDGTGFDPAHVVSGHYGLSMMRERAHAVGGQFSVESQLGQGTELILQWTRPVLREEI